MTRQERRRLARQRPIAPGLVVSIEQPRPAPPRDVQPRRAIAAPLALALALASTERP